jgi:hypothetical protein
VLQAKQALDVAIAGAVAIGTVQQPQTRIGNVVPIDQTS